MLVGFLLPTTTTSARELFIVMTNNYTHSDCSLIYIDENVPGPYEDSVEYDNIVQNFNSVLTHSCKCSSICTMNSCQCLTISGDVNYEKYEEGYRLNILKNIGKLSYPIVECNSLCNCTEFCGNRIVQKGPMCGLVVKTCSHISKGKGLFTTQFIPKGVFVCEYAGEIITLEQAKMRHKINQAQGKMNYIFCLNEFCNETQLQMIVDPSKLGNLGRYINHSCEPNSIIIPVRVDSPLPKLAIFTQVDIPPDFEITYDYGSNSFRNVEDEENLKRCLCSSKNCKGSMPSEKY